MQCNQAQELFSDHIAGHLDPALNLSVENHLRTCEACRTESIGLCRLWSSLDALPSVEPPAFFHENLMHRIVIEQARVTEDAQRQRSLWNWRALFQPRSPVFAAAVLLALALLGMGELHVQHASLDPLGATWRLMKTGNSPAEPGGMLQPPRAEWHPNGQGGGTLTIVLQAQPGASVNIHALNYRTSDRQRTASQNDIAVSADHSTTLTIPLDARPASEITLTLATPGSTGAKVPVTLMEPVSTPADSH
jgi:predicted anti-sigma-YlaC factor YlaD